MKHKDKNVGEAIELLRRECRGLSASQTIDYLAELGVLSTKHLSAVLARRLVDEYIKEGYAKMDAMERVVEDMHCSYSTIRSYIYYKPK